jgi:hypothetical protein
MITITNKTKTVLLGLSFVTVGLVLAESAQAASLTGPGTLDFAGEVGISVDTKGTPSIADDEFIINFDPTAPTPNIAILNQAAATGGFSSFGVGASVTTPTTGAIADLVVPFDIDGDIAFSVPNFISLNNPQSAGGGASGTTFDISRISEFNFEEIPLAGGGTSVIISTTVSGHWFDVTNELTLGGTITFSTQLDDTSLAEAQFLLFGDPINGIPAPGLPKVSFSAGGIAFEKTPEPSAMLALMSVFGAGLFVKKGRNAK